MAATRLRPCPFCIGAAKARSCRVAEDAEAAWVECTRCDAQTDQFEDAYAPHFEAADAWNRRPTPNQEGGDHG